MSTHMYIVHFPGGAAQLDETHLRELLHKTSRMLAPCRLLTCSPP